MSTYLSVVNSMLVAEGILAGDDDEISSFGSTQHVASIRLAKRAVVQELAHLVSRQLLPYEKTDAILTVSGRTATLASDFIRMQDENPFLLETDVSGTSQGTYIWEFPGGESQLRRNDLNYRENTGKPYSFYWAGGETKDLGFYLVPDGATYYYRYYYEKDVSVSVESDTVPFVSTVEAEAFTEIAARRFKYLRSSPTVREGLFPGGLARDAVIQEARSTLTQLMRYKPSPTTYGRRFK